MNGLQIMPMAQQKADAVASRAGGQFVLSGIQLYADSDLPKAETAEEARSCPQLLSGRSHRVMAVLSVSSEWRMANKTVYQPRQVQTSESQISMPISRAGNGRAKREAMPFRAERVYMFVR